MANGKNYVIFETTPGRYDLVEIPNWRVIASGSLDAACAAARLLGLSWEMMYPGEAGSHT
jgi:hypothetical protein